MIIRFGFVEMFYSHDCLYDNLQSEEVLSSFQLLIILPLLDWTVCEIIIIGWCQYAAKRGGRDDAPSISSYLVSNKKCNCSVSEQWNSTGLCIYISGNNYFSLDFHCRKIDVLMEVELVIDWISYWDFILGFVIISWQND